MSKINKEFDLIIIGGGPGGEGAAIMATKHGKKVLLIEKYHKIGGGCTHWGTIPSKSIRQAIVSLLNLRKIPYLGKEFFETNFSFPELINMSKDVIENQVSIKNNFYGRNHVEIIHGHASFETETKVKVSTEEFEEFFEAPHIIIAVGSKPYHDPNIDFNHSFILDSNSVLNLKETPKSITIYGAGIIGVEYACIFRNLGIKVDLINTRERVLDFLDPEMTDAFNYHMRDLGVVIRNLEVIKKIEKLNNHIVVELESGKIIKHQYLLFALGREGNTKGLNLEKVGIEINNRGYISVNENYQTSQKSIYAVGDVIGWPSLASVAFDQGKIASIDICKLENFSKKLNIFPTGIYTTPEISYIGKNEKELTAEKVPYEIGRANFKNIAKAQILGDNTGILKIIFHRETLEILGIHCFGRHASEIIHIGQVVMMQPGKQNTIKYFIETTFNYPTMAEAYRTAAQNGLNRLS